MPNDYLRCYGVGVIKFSLEYLKLAYKSIVPKGRKKGLSRRVHCVTYRGSLIVEAKCGRVIMFLILEKTETLNE